MNTRPQQALKNSAPLIQFLLMNELSQQTLTETTKYHLVNSTVSWLKCKGKSITNFRDFISFLNSNIILAHSYVSLSFSLPSPRPT